MAARWLALDAMRASEAPADRHTRCLRPCADNCCDLCTQRQHQAIQPDRHRGLPELPHGLQHVHPELHPPGEAEQGHPAGWDGGAGGHGCCCPGLGGLGLQLGPQKGMGWLLLRCGGTAPSAAGLLREPACRRGLSACARPSAVDEGGHGPCVGFCCQTSTHEAHTC